MSVPAGPVTADQSGPDPSNASPAEWEGVEYDNPGLEQQIAAAADPNAVDPLPADYIEEALA